MPSFQEILHGSEYATSIFSPKETSEIRLEKRAGKTYLDCFIRQKQVVAKPEEIIRQLYLRRLVKEYAYPKDRIAVEKPVYFGSTVHEKAADIVVFEKNAPTSPYIICEMKRPKRKDGLEQLKSYCNAEGSPIGVWTNGGSTVYYHREEPNLFRELPDIPNGTQTLTELLAKPWTIEDLIREDILVTERTSLRDIILDMENLVLANAGVDAFEEVFKLIYAKLYDEKQASRPGKSKRMLEFHVGVQTASEFSAKIDFLFRKAQEEWPGVFIEGDRINLEPDHLKVCGSALERVRLFHSNLQIIDEAFEYLSIKASKGEKGQYFTPRHAIDMCVKMLNPTIDEYVIDPAAGSCGFTVHSMFHVWGDDVFTASGPAKWQTEYASTHVYAMDFDPRSTKIARALNLIAGDGRTNVYRANTLDPRTWSSEVRNGLRQRLRRLGSSEENRRNEDEMRYFDFDVLLSNPPFAGEIKEPRILSQYELASRAKGGTERSVGRDLLFIERNLQFLKPGGRAAIILPQGRFNNSGDESLRRWLADRARILAVVGLHGNTFKPHTATKTSVLFLQTWNEDQNSPLYNPKLDDYPIFLATSDQPGKDNSGRYLCKIGDDNAPLLDSHGHMVVEHDLDDIAAAFIKWGRKLRLHFVPEAD